MTSQTVRNGFTSPVLASMQAPRMMRPILKRPCPLPLSPAVQSSSFSSLLSPSFQKGYGLTSPHVRFPSSPSQFIATIGTYSSSAYDRAPISISPNPVALPGWGERVYSPSIDGFRLSAAQTVFRSISTAHQPSPIVADFEDPRSPRLKPAADIIGSSANRFARLATAQDLQNQIKPLEKALTSYPRSPYPSAPFTQVTELEERGRQLPRTANDISEAIRVRAHAQSRDARDNKKNKHILTVGVQATPEVTSVPSPLGQTFVNSAPSHLSSLNRAHKPAPLALESDSAGSDQLSNAFWNSVSVDPKSADEPMVTALEYPESAVDYEEKMDLEVRSALQPPLMFASGDGVLFSPGLPRAHARLEKLRGSIQQQLKSPSAKRTSFMPIARKEITAPSPNDPFAAFPSFGAVLKNAGVEGAIKYPDPVVQRL
jgi:hypothetical protein